MPQMRSTILSRLKRKVLVPQRLTLLWGTRTDMPADADLSLLPAPPTPSRFLLTPCCHRCCWSCCCHSSGSYACSPSALLSCVSFSPPPPTFLFLVLSLSLSLFLSLTAEFGFYLVGGLWGPLPAARALLVESKNVHTPGETKGGALSSRTPVV